MEQGCVLNLHDAGSTERSRFAMEVVFVMLLCLVSLTRYGVHSIQHLYVLRWFWCFWRGRILRPNDAPSRGVAQVQLASSLAPVIT